MKRILILSLLLVVALTLPGCSPASTGGSVLDSSIKLIEEAEPTSDTPDKHSPLSNLAFAAYKFNRSSSWESEYTGTVTAIATNQKIKNVRKFDGEALFSQAVSYSDKKSVAEQKYFKNGRIFTRSKRGAIDSENMTATWSSNIVELSVEEYYYKYGAMPGELSKFVINESTVISSKPTSPTIDGAYAFYFELSTESAKYVKNEVRTLSGSKSDPSYQSIELTIEIDENYNLLRISGKEVYKLAIFAGITCTCTYTEDFSVNTPVTIAEKSIFEASIPSDGSEDVEYDSLDYLSLALSNLTSNELSGFKATLNGTDILINLDQSGSISVKCNDTVILIKGEFVYILGKNKAKIRLLSLYQAGLDLSSLASQISVPPEMPELLALTEELKVLFGIGDGSGESGSESENSVIGKIVSGIGSPIENDDGSVTINIAFSLDKLTVNADVTIANFNLSHISADITYDDSAIKLTLAPSEEKAEADTSGAHELSGLVEAIAGLAKNDYVSFEYEDALITIEKNGKIIADKPPFKLCYNGGVIKLDTGTQKLQFDLPDLTKLLDLNLDVFDLNLDLIKIIPLLDSIVLSDVKDEELLFTVTVESTSLPIRIWKDDALNIEVAGKTVALTDKAALFDETEEYVKIDDLISFLERDRFDLSLTLNEKPISLSIYPNKSVYAKVGDTLFAVTDALYMQNEKVHGKLSFDALGGISNLFTLPSLDANSDKSFLSQIVDLLKGCSFAVVDGTLRFDLSGTFADMTIDATATIGDEFAVTVTIGYGSKKYDLDICDGEAVEPFDTDGFISLDPIAYSVMEFMSTPTVFDVNIVTDKSETSAYIMPNFQSKELTISVGDLNLFLCDDLFISNKLGSIRISADTLTRIKSELFGSDPIDISDLDYSVQENGDLEVSLTMGDYAFNAYFDSATAFFARAQFSGKSFSMDITPSTAEPLAMEHGSPDDLLSGLITPIKNLCNSDAFTLKFDNVLTQGPTSISGFISIRELTNSLDVSLELNVTETETHTIRARLSDDVVYACYVYNDKSLPLKISKDSLLSVAFKAVDILGIKGLEKFRPASSEPISCFILSDALKKWATAIEKINALLDPEISLDMIIDIMSKIRLSQTESGLLFSLAGDAPVDIEVNCDESRIRSAGLNSIGIKSFTEVSDTFTDIEVGARNGFDLDRADELFDCLINTINLGEYTMSGSITLSVGVPNIINFTKQLNFDVTVKFNKNNKPYVYIKIGVPYVLGSLTKADSYLFYCDQTVYLKSERYEKPLLSDAVYKNTLYKKCTLEELKADLPSNIYFLVPLSDAIQTAIENSANSSVTEEKSYAEALTSFKATDDAFSLALDLKKLTGKGSLDKAELTLERTDGLLTKLLLKSAYSIIKISAEATLLPYDGTISYGINADNVTGDIADMPDKLTELSAKWDVLS